MSRKERIRRGEIGLREKEGRENVYERKRNERDRENKENDGKYELLNMKRIYLYDIRLKPRLI